MYIYICINTEQMYDSTKLSLLELPKKFSHTLLVPFRKKEEEAYQKLEQYISDQYNAIKRYVYV
jgi:hypothetical protein